MSDELELNNDEFGDNDDIKEEMFEADLMMQEELSEEFDEIVEIEDTDEKEVIINSINYDEDDSVESELDIYFKYGTNNHKLDGKHKLKRDTILNGKVNEEQPDAEDETQLFGLEYDSFENHLDHGNLFEEDSRNASEQHNRKKLSEDVYYLLKNNTDLDFNSNRRKPNKATFNNYYKMLLLNIDSQYTKSEIFVELAYYFTDNIFNMYKLLDKKYATIIIIELREKGFLMNLNNINFM